MTKRLLCTAASFTVLVAMASAQSSPAQKVQEPMLPYYPSLDLTSMDRTIDPCVNFYEYSCGGWKKNNPIPADQTPWWVYGKLYQDNLKFLRALLEQAAADSPRRDLVTKEIGDFYASCLDEAAVEKHGITPVESELQAIAHLKNAQELAPLIAELQLVHGRVILFNSGSMQDPDDSEQVIAQIDQGGLGLPDRDYYTKEDAKSKETRAKYLEHAQKVFELVGENEEIAKKDAATVMRLETALAKASMTRVDRRDPYKLKHKMKVQDPEGLAPKFDWNAFYCEAKYPQFEILNVNSPNFFKEVNALLASEPLDDWKTYLRFHVVDSASPYLSSKFVGKNFEFYRKYLRGVKEQQPRWKRCVSYTDHNLDDALGQAYVAKVFSPALRQGTLD